MLNVERAHVGNTYLRHQKRNRQSTLVIYKRGNTDGWLITKETEHFLIWEMQMEAKISCLTLLQHNLYRKEHKSWLYSLTNCEKVNISELPHTAPQPAPWSNSHLISISLPSLLSKGD